MSNLVELPPVRLTTTDPFYKEDDLCLMSYQGTRILLWNVVPPPLLLGGVKVLHGDRVLVKHSLKTLNGIYVVRGSATNVYWLRTEEEAPEGGLSWVRVLEGVHAGEAFRCQYRYIQKMRGAWEHISWTSFEPPPTPTYGGWDDHPMDP